MKPKILILIVVFFAMLLSACGSLSPFGNDPLDGTSWELVAIKKRTPVEGSRITLTFEDGQANGSSGCNQYGGGYKVNGDEIVFEPMAMTEMACADEALMKQENLYMKNLGKAKRFEILDGRLLVYWTEKNALTFAPISTP